AVADFLARCQEAAARISADALRQAGTAVAAAASTAEQVSGELAAIESNAARLGAALELMDSPEPGATPAADGHGSGVVEAVIGEVVDGAFELEVTEDKLQVYLTLHPAKGGRAVQLGDVRAALAQHGIGYGIDEQTLLQAVESGATDGALIASGIPPKDGQPTRFESLLTRDHAEVDENAVVDYRAMGNLVLVKTGMRLMRRIPGTAGTDGIDVFGNPAPAPAPENLPYDDNLSGVVRDADDPDVLVAAIDGAPSVLPCGISVNPVVEVDAVNLNSGNINFEGTLQVRGDVTTGMTVKVTGDVLVSGTVEAAHIDAGGNVVVKGGILGVAEGATNADSAARLAQITARGSVKARFIGNASINAGKDVEVESEIRQREVNAGDTVTVGAKGSSQGNISGGQVRALRAVRAATLGTMAGVKTIIQVGVNPHAQAQKEALQRTRKRLQEEKAKLEQLLIFLRKHPEKAANGIGERAAQTHSKLIRDLAGVDARERRLIEENSVVEEASIHASRKIHGGVELQVVNRREEVAEDLPGGTAKLSDGKLIIR
ncbi:MAG TPA: FapA family protein, partial [Bordetella sp.]|nr:FapA family protein [Bordetella sp.]